MGKLSCNNPMRRQARLRGYTCGALLRVCAVLALTGGAPAAGRAQATAVPLALPAAVVFDAQGNLYIAETGNHVVRKFSVAGATTVIAGSGVQGFAGDGGAATAAELDSPGGLAMDAAGNLYIADTHNHRVREVAAATGTIATIAGTGAAGFSGDGAAATAAQLDRPTALAVDAAGNVCVADTGNHRVRRIAKATGVITTVAGDGVEGFAGDGGAATAAAIDSPNGLVVDAVGNLYLADTHNGRVREVSAATGVISTIAGVGFSVGNMQAFGGDGGAATAAGLALPRGLTMDAAGNLYVADSANQRVRRISTSGTITTVAGQGTETFAGDGAPAVAASLDTPRAVAVSPAGLLTLTDSDNQRIRQLDALPSPGPDIHTIAGIGWTVAGTLTLSGPSVVAYGSGTVTATLSGSGNATGSFTFLDASGGAMTTLGTAVLTADAASFSTGGLAAGAHSIVTTYAGDATHSAVESAALALTVSPLSVAVTANPASILYGQSVPVLTGVLSGVLARDAGKVTAVFTASAGALAPVGAYPIAVALIGSAAGNYTVSVLPASLTIAQAPTLTSASTSTAALSLGGPMTLNVQAASTTSGVPSGSVTVIDGTAVLSVVQLAGGTAAFSTSALALGSHSLSAAYSGDGNFLPSISAGTNVTVGAAADFTLAATGATTQMVAAGSAATFNFSAGIVGTAMASPITLAVQGTPVGATASLNPQYLPPDGAVSSFTLTIRTPVAGIDERSWPFGQRHPDSGVLAILLLPGIGFVRRVRRAGWWRLRLIFTAGVYCIVLVTVASGCGDRINTAPETAGAQSYTLTVTGTATSSAGTAVEHSVNVTLEVVGGS